MPRAAWIALCSGVLGILAVAGFVLHRRSAERAALETAFLDYYAAFNRRDLDGLARYIRDEQDKEVTTAELATPFRMADFKVDISVLRVIVRGDEGQVVADMRFRITHASGEVKEFPAAGSVSEWIRVDGRWYVKKPGRLPSR